MGKEEREEHCWNSWCKGPVVGGTQGVRETKAAMKGVEKGERWMDISLSRVLQAQLRTFFFIIRVMGSCTGF